MNRHSLSVFRPHSGPIQEPPRFVQVGSAAIPIEVVENREARLRRVRFRNLVPRGGSHYRAILCDDEVMP